MVWIASCEGIVWAVSASGELWYRAGISQNNPMGTNWFKMDTRPNAEAWKQAVMYEGSLWGIDGTDVVRCKEQATQDQIVAGNSITLMEEFANFKSFNIHEKPSSFRVLNGGWVIYEKPNFKGKCLYFYEGRALFVTSLSLYLPLCVIHASFSITWGPKTLREKVSNIFFRRLLQQRPWEQEGSKA